MNKYYVTHGRTESGDTIIPLLFTLFLSEEEVYERYMEIYFEEYEGECLVIYEQDEVSLLNDLRQIMINLLFSISLADHVGEAMEDCVKALKKMGLDFNLFLEENSFDDLISHLEENYEAEGIWA